MADSPKPYVVRQGDHLAKIAQQNGCDPDAIWSHPKNEAVRKVRGDGHTLNSGDVLFIPKRDAKPLDLQVGASNTFVANVPTIAVHVTLGNKGGAFANEAYEVRGLGDDPLTGTTDGSGKVSFEAPVTAREVEIALTKRGLVVPLRIGDLDPITEISGVQQRLAALGYGGTSFEGELDEPTRGALRLFQRDKKLGVTGEAEQATLDALRSAYGS